MRTRSILLVALLALVRPAGALNFFELDTYPATTEGEGLHEIESFSTYVANGRSDDRAEGDEPRTNRLLRTSVEYNYGLTDKIDGAMYVDFQRPNGAAPEYAGARFRLRGSVFDKGRFPVDLGWYVEAEVPHHGPADLELEFRPILSTDLGRFTIDLNPAFDLPTVASERRTLEFSYAARIAYRASRALSPALEFYGGIGQIRAVDPLEAQEHYVVPVLLARPLPGLRISVGPGFGMTSGSEKVFLKLGIEYEFTLPFRSHSSGLGEN